MSRILVVDDESAIRKVVRDTLQRAGHDVETAINGAEALELLEERIFDLVLTDISMPTLDGFELVRRIRRSSEVPILALTIHQEETQKVQLLNAGADDYMTKPFGVNELVARVRALLRRAERLNEAEVLSRFGDVEVDRETRIVTRNGSRVHLTPTEFSLLTTMLSKPGAVWTHEQLLTAVWGPSTVVSNETLRVHMGSLRRKLEADPHRPHFILTEPWVGYRFSPE